MDELNKGMAALRSGDLEEARTLLAQAVSQAPLNADAYEGLADVLEQQGRIEIARDLCETALIQIPESIFLHRKAVSLNMTLEDLESAERAAERFVLAFDDDGDAWLALGDVLAKAGRTDRALRSYQHAQDRSEDDWRPWHRMGLIHEKKDDARSACVAFRNAARLAPENHRPMRALARVLKRQDKNDEAQEAFDQAQRLAQAEEHQNRH
jgi:tetratricopeptide (TPR) repeat protein